MHYLAKKREEEVDPEQTLEDVGKRYPETEVRRDTKKSPLVGPPKEEEKNKKSVVKGAPEANPQPVGDGQKVTCSGKPY